MSSVLISELEVVAIPGNATDRILSAGNSDAAMFYLGLTRYGGDVQRTRNELRWEEGRFLSAWRTLVSLRLVKGGDETIISNNGQSQIEVQRKDIVSELSNNTDFSELQCVVEIELGKVMSDYELKSLYNLYVNMNCPSEVIFFLVKWCAYQQERKYKRLVPPNMHTISQEGFKWKRNGIVTLEAVKAFLENQKKYLPSEDEILTRFGIKDHIPTEREKRQMSAWIDMGFDVDTICSAFDMALAKGKGLNWGYADAILRTWHNSGWHTVDKVEHGISCQSNYSTAIPGQQPNYEPTPERIKASSDWLDEFLSKHHECDLPCEQFSSSNEDLISDSNKNCDQGQQPLDDMDWLDDFLAENTELRQLSSAC